MIRCTGGRGSYLTWEFNSSPLDVVAGFRKSWPARMAALQPICILTKSFIVSGREIGAPGMFARCKLGPRKRPKYCSSTWGDPARKSRHRWDIAHRWRCMAVYRACSSMREYEGHGRHTAVWHQSSNGRKSQGVLSHMGAHFHSRAHMRSLGRPA